MEEDLEVIAETELRETPVLREEGLAAMRAWIEKHPHIKHCRTDDAFLLRFLRTKKYSILLAQEMLERYILVRKLYPHWFTKLDVDDPEISAILDTGYILPLEGRDLEGRQVIFSVAGNFDPHVFTSDHMARVHSLVVESLLDDPNNQIRGYTHINDESGLSLSHVGLWSLTDIRNMLRCIQESTPMRHKATHFINVPNCASKLFEFFTALLSDKLKQRVMWHKNMDELKKHIDIDILPKEYGGKVPLKEMIERYKARLREQRKELLDLDLLEIDQVSKSWQPCSDGLEASISGTFRKLEID